LRIKELLFFKIFRERHWLRPNVVEFFNLFILYKKQHWPGEVKPSRIFYKVKCPSVPGLLFFALGLKQI